MRLYIYIEKFFFKLPRLTQFFIAVFCGIVGGLLLYWANIIRPQWAQYGAGNWAMSLLAGIGGAMGVGGAIGSFLIGMYGCLELYDKLTEQ